MEPTDSVNYGSCDLDLFPGSERSKVEARILEWLESKSISMTDPHEKKDNQNSDSMKSIISIESIESLPSLKSLERKSLQLTGEGGAFLKESNTWKLKNRRLTGDLESIPQNVRAVEN